jgi:inhibitor of KinA
MKINNQNIDKIEYYSASDQGLIVSFAAFPEEDAIVLSRRLGEMLRAEPPLGLRDVIPGMNNVLINYDCLLTSLQRLKDETKGHLLGLDTASYYQRQHWRLPVCYGGVYGEDLPDVATRCGLSKDEVIARHTSHPLTVAIMGFLPGLAYMKGVDDALYLPRRSSPRQYVPALSLGIAMDQTVIYPLASPGGWNLIGRVPVRPFDSQRDDPVLFRAGDEVTFYAVDEGEFLRLDAAASAGEVIVTPELISGDL